MERQVLDTSGMPYPNVVFKIAIKAVKMHPGDILQVVGDCPTFEKAVRDWCRKLGKDWLVIKEDVDNKKTIWIAL